MKTPEEWEFFLNPYIDLKNFYNNLEALLQHKNNVMPKKALIFNAFNYLSPQTVQCVLYGEDPYPRQTSANGVAFWDVEIKSWADKTNGNSLKNILKALLVDKQLATYNTNIEKCREIARKERVPTPAAMFELWLKQGVLPVNTAMTFTGKEYKSDHFAIWEPFHLALIKALNEREQSPFYILWGNKARRWENAILESIDSSKKIIHQGHPTFIHQFLDKNNPTYSPFTEIRQKINIKWL